MKTISRRVGRLLSFLMLLTLLAASTHAASADCGITGCTCTGSCGWTYTYSSISAAQHRRYLECTGCGQKSFLWDDYSHNMSGGVCADCGYSDGSASCDHDNTQLSWSGCHYDEYCADCGEYLGFGTSHGSTYTEWSGCHWYRYCNVCGELTDSGTSHGSYSYGAWEYYNSSRHRRFGSCSDCGEGSYFFGNHTRALQYVPYNETLHQYGQYCALCASFLGKPSSGGHSFSYGAWISDSAEQHCRAQTCSLCGYAAEEYESHADADGNGACDVCSYPMLRFSVTVPTVLRLTVSKTGEVFAAEETEIVNGSSDSVTVTGIVLTAENGWTLVPYAMNMADEKVDAKKIGFRINGAESRMVGKSESLALSGDWTIAVSGSLALRYDAVVSAMSAPVNEQVLTVVFVLELAA